MRNISIVLNVVLLVAVGILYVLYFAGHNGKTEEQTVNKEAAGGAKIVYINTDSLLSKYLLSNELNKAFLDKQEERRTDLNIRAQALDKDYNDFQRKLQNNGFISEARAREASDQILARRDALQRLQQDLQEKMMREQNELNKKLYDAITFFLSEYNKEKGYDIILSTTLGGNVLFAQHGFDITDEVVTQLNENYNRDITK